MMHINILCLMTSLRNRIDDDDELTAMRSNTLCRSSALTGAANELLHIMFTNMKQT